VSDTTPQLGGDLASNGNDINFADNDKAIFGTGSDLQIYHDGSSSYISDVGAGNLRIKSNGVATQILDGSSLNLAVFNSGNGQAQLYNVDSGTSAIRLATTSTGIDVTGTVTSDGLTVDTDQYRRLLLTYPDAFTSKLQVGFSNFYVQGSATNDRLTIANNSSGQTHFENQSKTSMVIDNSGDISFYEDTGTTAKFFWDASAESLGIGTSSPVVNLHTTSGVARTSTAKTETAFFSTDDTDDFRFGLAISHKGGATGNDRYASLDSTTYQVSTDTFSESGSLVLQEHGGSVGIGTSSPRSDSVSTTLEVSDSTTARAIIKSTGTGGREYGWYSSTSGQFGLYDYTANTERMRIDSSGRVTMPYQPSFSVSKTGGAVGPGTFVVWNHVEHNIGSHYNSSNGAFTAPVSGVYAVSLNVMDESTSTHINKQLNIYRNSYIYQRVYGTNDAGGSHGRWTWSGNIYMSANDTLQILVNDMTIYAVSYTHLTLPTILRV
jgi:hypothetical protein